jgi:uncharacterized membrane protein YeaQ/YmgE (transglycosylase-associated protein family)
LDELHPSPDGLQGGTRRSRRRGLPNGSVESCDRRADNSFVEKMTILIGMVLGSVVGGWLPVALFDSGWFSVTSLVCSFAGAVAGVWAGWKLTQWIDS